MPINKIWYSTCVCVCVSLTDEYPFEQACGFIMKINTQQAASASGYSIMERLAMKVLSPSA